ncbi:hypothetical protein, partial [Dethiothermospora halolimnae]|uniref:hypothetical protein n=1 Tax=Dethiothermospora halolimnae TaxID=3114390 RepID=UPI003CCB7C36
MIGFNNIKIESPLKINTLLEMKMEQGINEHGKLYIKAIVEEEEEFDTSINTSLGDEIYIYGEDEGKKDIFKGIIYSIEVKNTTEVYTAEIHCISGSYMLDTKEKNRSFQDKEMEYPALIEEIIKDYKDKDYNNIVGDGVKIKHPIIQYKESDWQLLKRLVSQFNQVLVCDIIRGGIRFHFGMPKGDSVTIPEDIPYTATKDIFAYKKAKALGGQVTDIDFFYYIVESY